MKPITEVSDHSPTAGGGRLRMRCPVCLHEALMDQRGQDLQLLGLNIEINWATGQRVCPNEACRALIFVVYNSGYNTVVASYPPERLDFDASGLPDSVLGPLAEAVECHAHECYRASAVMIRRTLEALCQDQHVEGGNLYIRVENLGRQIVLPKGFIEGLHNLRLLGNDAAHIEAKDYDIVGKREVEVGIEVTKVILQATYQMSSILGELEALKATEGET